MHKHSRKIKVYNVYYIKLVYRWGKYKIKSKWLNHISNTDIWYFTLSHGNAEYLYNCTSHILPINIIVNVSSDNTRFKSTNTSAHSKILYPNPKIMIPKVLASVQGRTKNLKYG